MIVVIGHGPSARGRGWGRLIDKYEVVRMKDWGPQSWQRTAFKDYGTRLDYWCCSTEIMAAWFIAGVAKEYWAQPKKHVWNPDNERSVRGRGIDVRIDLELFQRWNFVYQGLTDKHRNYCLGLHCILKVCERGEVPVLVGFDNLLNPKLRYVKADRGYWKSDHDWEAENAMLPLIEKNYGVRIHVMTDKGPEPWDSGTT